MAEDDVALELTRDEAIVVFAWLSRFNNQPTPGFEDQAEQRVLWDLECMLESALDEPFRPDFAEIVVAARSRVRDSTE
jgi:hypothetical protein